MRLTARHGFVALFLLACSSAPPPEAEAAKPPEKCVAPRPHVTITASAQVNAGPDGRGLPVQVRVYQLKSEAKLLNAFFEEMWNDAAKTLAEDLVSVRELTAFPGQTEQFDLDQSPDSRVLAAVALFREPRGKDWFVSYELALAKQEAPCPPSEPRISIWLDRMKIQDGEGRVQAGEGAPAEADPNGSGGPSSSSPEGARHAGENQ
jgi:type VI secretion system protein VasD